MRKLLSVIPFLLLFVLISCNQSNQPGNSDSRGFDTTAFMQLGDSITVAVQQVLLSNVMLATKAGGAGHAVAFCNERAMALTDSLALKYNCRIQRISDKYRNPANKPGEKEAALLKKPGFLNAASPLIFNEDSTLVYYKPIRVAMPACLSCHGAAGKDILPGTLEVIRQKYHDDLATGYKEGDFRGLWKITFTKE
ncbi:MAG: DUF3365 domain-containing protein [Lentimicrobium sp.]|uniref:Tll0287-like domain-containing protein n=1 Tax=Lentimicrobium sp. TaxID=2034841 RepID=UPI0025E59013|nr:DUF3365 domain-containing protein [Lentimicrobium sp.]MCO5257264.1 DUF3365 domain-containing protein [Lentimicrobium sp.]